ncbi:alpha/beta hydrolase fold domain-containing protein [Oleomonas cavernae]|uniref:alpha/beta hydrolase fold domain-containing protein n=1 Tax=Oleomonas cavernae TaxID=2320859 RepID=UPI0011C3C7BD|nr:alpha/beta hydrolase fold domain-containing protein [Oleomonas cavernae]
MIQAAIRPSPLDDDAREGIRVMRHPIERPDGSALDLRAYLPACWGTARPALCRLAAGGAADDRLARRLAALLGCVVVSVDYARGPDGPLPQALDDCYAGLAWLHSQTALLKVDPHRVAVAAPAREGGLALALLRLARRRRVFPIVCALRIETLDDLQSL